MAQAPGYYYDFGPFRLDPAERLLLRNGVSIPVPPKPFMTLVLLVERSGHVWEKQELMRAVWPETFVEENNLTQCISNLRKILGDEGDSPSLIETVPRLGYRFAGKVHKTIVAPEAHGNEESRPAATPSETTGARDSDSRGAQGWSWKGWKSVWRPAAVLMAGVLVALALAAAASSSSWSGPWRERIWGRKDSTQIRSLAVLPLENVSGDASQEYFSDGMTDTLITDLARIDGLRVISRTSTIQYKGTRKPVPQIAGELGVDAIVEGTVFRSGDRVRINAQLIEGPHDRHLWAESYERDMRDVLALQNQLAWAITREIQVKLTPEEQRRLAATPSVNAEAYQLFLQGKFMLNTADEPSLRKAARDFEASIAKDPSYAPAHAALAWTYGNLASDGYEAPSTAFPKMQEEAAKALELDPLLPEAHLMSASAVDWDWPTQEKEIKRTLELYPNCLEAHNLYGSYLQIFSRFDEAIAEMRRAQELDPANPQAAAFVGTAYVYAQRYDESIPYLKKALELDPNHLPAHAVLAWSYALAGKRNEAKAEYEKTRKLMAPRKALILDAWLVPVDLMLGKRDEALRVADWWSKQSSNRYVDGYWLGAFYAQLGKKEPAFRWLETGFNQHSSAMSFLKMSRDFPDDMRADPRYHDLLRRMKLEQ